MKIRITFDLMNEEDICPITLFYDLEITKNIHSSIEFYVLAEETLMSMFPNEDITITNIELIESI